MHVPTILNKTVDKIIKIIEKFIRQISLVFFPLSSPLNVVIHDYGEDSGMYIFPQCIAKVNWKLLSKDDTRSPNDIRNFSRINKSTSCLTSILQKTSIRFLKDLWWFILLQLIGLMFWCSFKKLVLKSYLQTDKLVSWRTTICKLRLTVHSKQRFKKLWIAC